MLQETSLLFAAGARAPSALCGVLRPWDFKTRLRRTGRAVHSAMRQSSKAHLLEEFDHAGFDLASSIRGFDLARDRNLTPVQEFDQ